MKAFDYIKNPLPETVDPSTTNRYGSYSNDKPRITKLSEGMIDSSLMDRDERKPVRKVVDDYVAPAAGAALGAGAAAVGAVSQLKRVTKDYHVT
jgi:hypothetical protein